jgi:predicted RNA-binding protein with RPS1 domain
VNFKPGFGATVQISKDKYGFIDITEISDELEPRVDLVLSKKAIFTARVLEIGKYQLSIRESMIDNSKYQILQPSGTSLQYKKEFGVAESQGDIRNLIYKFENWRELIDVNKLIRGYVTS